MPTITGTAAADVLAGTSGDDTILGLAGNDELYGKDGADHLLGGLGDDVLDGGDGDDYIRGDEGNDKLLGGDGDDYLRGGAGKDSFDGGAGIDRVSFFHLDATQGVIADLRVQKVYNDGYGNAEKMSSIEGLGDGTMFADQFYGDDGDNLILGARGDHIEAFKGDDTFQIDDAVAFLDAGDGIDTILRFSQMRLVDTNGDGIAEIENGTNGVRVSLEAHRIQDDGWGGTGWIWNVENLGGSAGDDVLTGDAGDNVINGWEGDDMIRAGAGNDTLDGGDGDDQLRGGAGEDVFIGGAGFDRVSFYHFDATQGVIADLRDQTVYNDGYGNKEKMDSIEGLGAGTIFDDQFYGDDGDNLILAARKDTAEGFKGDDTFQIDDAPDLVDGGDGIDSILVFTQTRLVDTDGDGVAEIDYGTNGVWVDLSIGQIVDDGWGNSGTLKSIENLGGSYGDDVLIGDENDNRLTGWDGKDEISGGKGNDVLDGGAGNDALKGGAGDDTFVFQPGSGSDVIGDFIAGGTEDTLDFSAFAGTGATYSVTQVGPDVVFAFSTGETVTVESVSLGSMTSIDPWHWG
ncbi:calcium-binding protein [Caulobacter sp. 17J65-9]|uniref:calcium-binding protein n=1 Tax=Caulobacter sp. 17J65-9 TaxID=2709382 RepID=UPI0023E4233E|nr:calcium-binding protein [Caulobacter sp. 17J65-9]